MASVTSLTPIPPGAVSSCCAKDLLQGGLGLIFTQRIVLVWILIWRWSRSRYQKAPHLAPKEASRRACWASTFPRACYAAPDPRVMARVPSMGSYIYIYIYLENIRRLSSPGVLSDSQHRSTRPTDLRPLDRHPPSLPSTFDHWPQRERRTPCAKSIFVTVGSKE